MGLMTGKRGLIMGLANDKSIAWGIAEALQAEGAQIGVTYVGDAMKKRVLPLAEQLNATIVAECDAGDPASIAALMKQAKEAWGQIDFIVHAIGFSDKSELRGQYINTSRDNFLMTMDISAYSFTAILQAARAIGARRILPDHDLLRRGKSYAQLQCYGRGKGSFGSLGALFGRGLGALQYPRQRDLSGNHQNPSRLRHRRFSRDYEME